MSEKLPAASGVYQIKCTANSKIYIGSTIDFHHRWHQHQSRLNAGTHQNRYLQAAWKKHGVENFEFSILEYVDKSKLLQSEQSWLDQTKCYEREIGFNLYKTAGSPGDKNARIWHGFIDPNGNEVTIVNLNKFCRQNDLSNSSMLRLAKGKSKLKSYKGWTHPNSVRKRDFIKTYHGFIAPNGERVETIINLAAFCRENGLDKTHMVAVANGRIYSHRGWTYNNGRQNLSSTKTYHNFVNPEGQLTTITNLSLFCRENNLCVVKMHNVKSGKRKSHKGWTWRKTDESNNA